MASYSRSQAKSWLRGLSGYFVIVTTPYRADGELDYDGLRRNIAQSLALPGVTGLYLGSIYQEFWTLTLAERMRITEVAARECDGHAIVMAGVSSTCARDSMQLARAAADAGADALMVWPPFYGPRDDDGMMKFFESVASASDLAICSYSTTIPELGFYLAPGLAQRLATIDTFAGVKEASRSLSTYSEMVSAVGESLCVSSPLEEYTLFGLATFGRQYVPALLLGSSRPLYVQNASHPYCAQFVDALQAGDIAQAAAALRPMLWAANRLHNRFVGAGAHNVGLVKYITELAGMAGGPVRPPMSSPTEAEKADARAVLAEIGLRDVLGAAKPAA
jgi:4-hydroxy-tetrahydrodipicolinate synthase